MYSLTTPRITILVRPSTSTYLIAPRYRSGRCRVKASRVSYRWLSASKTRNSHVRAVAVNLRDL
jgi:hypothetical protein